MGPARLALLLSLFYAALLADTVAGPKLALGRASPDWTALALVVWLLRTRSNWAPLTAGGLGWLTDLAAGGRVGPGIAAFALAGYLIPRLAAKLPSRQVLVEAVAVAVGTFGIGLVVCTAAFVAAELADGPVATILHLFSTAAYTACAAIPVLMLRNWLQGHSPRTSWRAAG